MDDTASGQLIFLLCFWLIVIALTQVFSEDLHNQQILNMGINCLKPYTTCPNLPTENSNSISSLLNSVLNGIFNILNQVPVVNLLTPIMRIMFFQSVINLPPLVSLLMDLISVFTGIIAYKMVRG